MCRQGFLIAINSESSLGPANEAGNTMASFILGTLLGPHAGRETVPAAGCAFLFSSIVLRSACRRTIVGHENHNRVVGQLPFIELVEQLANVLINVGDHAV